MTIYDKNGQPYDADLVAGEESRALRKENATLALSNRLLDDENNTLRKLNSDASDAFAYTMNQWSRRVYELKQENTMLRALVANPTSL